MPVAPTCWFVVHYRQMAQELTISQVASMGGRARWRGVSKAERSAQMREILRRRYAGRAKREPRPKAT